MSISALRRTRWVFSVMVVAVFSALLLVGCGKDDDGDDEKKGKETEQDIGGNVVLGDGQAWIGTDEDGEQLGMIFKENKDLISIMYFQEEGLEGWFGGIIGTWSTNGNKITLTIDGEEGEETMTGTYSVSGNTLTITIDGERQTLTKTSNITYTDFSSLAKSPNGKKSPLLKKLFKK